MPAKQKSGKGGTRKIGRSLARCARYKSAGTRERNKRKKILCYLRAVVKKALKHGRTLSQKAVAAMTRDDIGKSLLPILRPAMSSE